MVILHNLLVKRSSNYRGVWDYLKGWLFFPIKILMVFVFCLQQVGIDRGDIPDLSQVSPDANSTDNHLVPLQLP